MKANKNIRVLLSSLGFLVPLCASAEDASFWGADIFLGSAHQEYNSATADMNSVSFTPYILAAGWEISMSIPWYDVDGNYFTNGRLPRIIDACHRLLGLSETRQQRLIRRGVITRNQLEACQTAVNELEAAEASASGLGDLGFFANYVISLNESASWWGGLGLGYSLDNGDYEKGLGKGATDASIHLSLGSSIGKWQTQYTLGYVSVNATDTTDDINDYAQASASVAYSFTDWFSLGVDYAIEQSYIADEENIKIMTLNGDFSFAEEWKIHVYLSDYADVKSYPETEVGLSIGYSF